MASPHQPQNLLPLIKLLEMNNAFPSEHSNHSARQFHIIRHSPGTCMELLAVISANGGQKDWLTFVLWPQTASLPCSFYGS